MNEMSRLILSLGFLAAALCAIPLSAQNALPIMSPPNPGARSLALGGAFVAQADDATAAYSNPAGLVALVRPEISGELRFSIDSDVFESGFDELNDNGVFSLGFLSAVYPIGRWSVAMYRNQFATINTTTEETDDIFDGLELTTLGLSCGYRLNDDLSFGLGIAYHEGDIGADISRNQVATSADNWGITAGIIWRLGEQWQVGSSFRSGPEVEIGPKDETEILGFPDVAAVGFSYRTFADGLTISGEWDYVWYSNMGGVDVDLDDEDELHLGIEYAILTSNPIMALRFGVWHDPVGGIDGQTGERRGEMHFSSGFGLAFERFQIDFALDYSEPLITTSVSGIFVF